MIGASRAPGRTLGSYAGVLDHQCSGGWPCAGLQRGIIIIIIKVPGLSVHCPATQSLFCIEKDSVPIQVWVLA